MTREITARDRDPVMADQQLTISISQPSVLHILIKENVSGMSPKMFDWPPKAPWIQHRLMTVHSNLKICGCRLNMGSPLCTCNKATVKEMETLWLTSPKKASVVHLAEKVMLSVFFLFFFCCCCCFGGMALEYCWWIFFERAIQQLCSTMWPFCGSCWAMLLPKTVKGSPKGWLFHPYKAQTHVSCHHDNS